MKKVYFLSIFLLLFTSGLFFVTKIYAAESPPEFSVTVGGSSRGYSAYTQVDSSHWSVEDSFLKATIGRVNTNQWQLDLTAKQIITQVNFPWMPQRQPLDSDISDDIYYYPLQFGITGKATNRNSDALWGVRYPGDAFAPLVVIADSNDAQIVAAANWPPKTVTPKYGGQKMILEYNESITAGTTATYGAIVAKVSGNTAIGQAPWQFAVDYYRDWLNLKMGKPTYPDWIWQGEGSLSIWLHAISFDINYIDKIWQEVKSIYPLF